MGFLLMIRVVVVEAEEKKNEEEVLTNRKRVYKAFKIKKSNDHVINVF